MIKPGKTTGNISPEVPLLSLLIGITILFFSFSCTSEKENHFSIGVSLANDDLWHQAVINEMQHEVLFYSDMELELKYQQKENDIQQLEDIDRFIAEKKDLIVVSAGNAAQITPVVQKAYKANIPVIILDQKIETEDYTAYVGGDNYQIGKDIASFVAARLQGHGNVVEMRGKVESLTDIERHKGFREVISGFPDIHIVAEDRAEFDTRIAKQKMLKIIQQQIPLDLIFAMDDLTAKGVNEAYREAGIVRPFTIGVDAIYGEGGGIDNVIKGYQDVSFIYPTGGDKVLEIAHDILTGKPYQRNTILYTGIVDRSNAHLIREERAQFFSAREKTNKMNHSLDKTRKSYSKQRIFLYISIFLVVLISSICFFYFKANASKKKSRKKLEEQLQKIEEQNQNYRYRERVENVVNNPQEEYIERFRNYVMANITDASLSVESISKEMGESSVNMYRKIKSYTGHSPIELIKIIRLDYAKQLLKKTSLSISEVAYDAGFSTHSYFTRCFKEFYNENPSDYIKGLKDKSV